MYVNENIIEEIMEINKHIVFVFIGTDKHVWDSLGPMTGTMLKDIESSDKYSFYGCLNNPLGLKAIAENIDNIKASHSDSVFIAVDGAVTKKARYHNKILIMRKGLVPGKAFGNKSEPIGDYSITYNIHESDVLNKSVANPYKAAQRLSNLIRKLLYKEDAPREAITDVVDVCETEGTVKDSSEDIFTTEAIDIEEKVQDNIMAELSSIGADDFNLGDGNIDFGF